jgi:hypothetical protein
MRGFPLGNGRLGAIVWFEPNAIVWQMNRCDLFDDVPGDQFQNWNADEEDRVAALRHAGQVRIEFSLPLFDRFYLRDCHGELDLSTGTASLSVTSEYGSVSFQALVDYDSDTMLFRAETDLAEADAPRVVLERRGSRTFSHWYALVRREPGLGLLPTETQLEDDAFGLVVELSGREFAFGGHVSPPATYERVNANAVKAQLPSAQRHAFEGAVGCTAPLAADSWGELKASLAASDWEQAAASTAARWRGFWEKLYVDYGDEYLNSLYHLALYALNASQRGSYPGRFINGLWSWNRDAQPWNFFFHWNQQQVYWSVAAAGHPELCEGYLALRTAGLPHAVRDAEKHFGLLGAAMVSDVTDKAGRNSVAELENHTPVAQIALDFYRYYQYTRDLGFLRERAFPYMMAAARFLRSRFSEGPDGLLHAAPATGYEGWIKLTDNITEISCLQALLKAVLEAAEQLGESFPEQADFADVLGRLAPYPILSVAPFTSADGALGAGCFAGTQPRSPHVFGAGRYAETGELTGSFLPSSDDDPSATRTNEGIFPWVELCPVFPTGCVGIGDTGTELFETAANTARLMSPDAMGWCPLPIVLARLGLTEEAESVTATFPERWQWFPNGFGHYGPREQMVPECQQRFLQRMVADAANPQETFPTEMWAFRHMGLEPLGVFSTAVTESLLQSYDGVVRVFPARGGDAAFTLYAVGGTRVTSEQRDGTTCFVALENPHGGTARIANPWETAAVYDSHGQLLHGPTGEPTLELDFTQASAFVLLPGDGDWADLQTAPVAHDRNQAPRRSRNGTAMLGMPPLF